MNKSDRCGASQAKPAPNCQAPRQIETVQPFPKNGPLAVNLGIPLPVLRAEIGKVESRAYSYVLSTVDVNHETTAMEQYGSAPNFQGGVLTLCTCKHQMRATQAAASWEGVWVAGFTSRTVYRGRHWLFYFAKIASAHESHADLWNALKTGARNAKAADANFLGDVFQPKSPSPTGDTRFLTSRYVVPTFHVHRRTPDQKAWRRDIQDPRHPPLLMADPRMTFLWKTPRIYFVGDHCRNYRKWSSVSELISELGEG